MRMLLKRTQGNEHEEGENEKWEQMKNGHKSRIADEVIDRARVQVSFFFLPFFFFPFLVLVIPFPVSLFKVRANGCNNVQQVVQTDAKCNIQSSNNNVVCVCTGPVYMELGDPR